MNEKLKLELELFPAQMVLAKECQSEIAILNKLVIPVIRYVRTELDLPFNELSYTEVIENSQKKQTVYVNQFIADVAKDIEQMVTRSIEKSPNPGVVPEAAKDAAPRTP